MIERRSSNTLPLVGVFLLSLIIVLQLSVNCTPKYTTTRNPGKSTNDHDDEDYPDDLTDFSDSEDDGNMRKDEDYYVLDNATIPEIGGDDDSDEDVGAAEKEDVSESGDDTDYRHLVSAFKDSNFYRLLMADQFIDKSHFIVDYLKQDQSISRILRPSGWGKSTNLDMLRRFLEVKRGKARRPDEASRRFVERLFCGGNVTVSSDDSVTTLKALKVCRRENARHIIDRYLGKHPVIFLSFRNVTGDTYDEIEDKMRSLIRDAFRAHHYSSKALMEVDTEYRRYANGSSDRAMLVYSLQLLGDALFRYYNETRVFILIDDYDVPLIDLFSRLYKRYRLEFRNESSSNERIFERVYRSDDFHETFEFFWSFFENNLRDNRAAKRSLLAGTVALNFYSLDYGGLENVVEYSVQSREKLGRHFGFTESEIGRLVTDKSRYRYYEMADGTPMYSAPPSSDDNPGDGLVDCLLVSSSNKLQKDLQSLVAGAQLVKPISKYIEFSRLNESAYSYLLYAGYLVSDASGYGDRKLSVPNERAMVVLKKKIVDWISARLNVSSVEFERLADLLAELKVETFRAGLMKFLPEHSPLTVIAYHAMMKSVIFLLETDYTTKLFDQSVTAFVPKPNSNRKNSILFEYRIVENAKTIQTELNSSLTRVEHHFRQTSTTKRYRNIGKTLRLVIIICGTRFRMEYRIDRNS